MRPKEIIHLLPFELKYTGKKSQYVVITLKRVRRASMEVDDITEFCLFFGTLTCFENDTAWYYWNIFLKSTDLELFFHAKKNAFKISAQMDVHDGLPTGAFSWTQV